MNPLTTTLTVLAGLCLLAVAVYRLRRAARWIDETLQDAQHPNGPDSTAS